MKKIKTTKDVLKEIVINSDGVFEKEIINEFKNPEPLGEFKHDIC